MWTWLEPVIGRKSTHEKLITLKSLAVDVLDNQWWIEKHIDPA